ncbi:hypothetical protein, conserved [Eimeria tenella]|uniref:Uncharacterized protein n=1 Tax=Eimeria tenella TaxID=5802 RepID=U6KNU2_EIMTE|nr:hypothetical protein, conserved [Eimeria tenella]CDJ37123.1 hypothetical protein, conserved [Eimeria tenella]|eukprot:XP_013227961.1 hypothetical protein, conserved [Eimeria tenella]
MGGGPPGAPRGPPGPLKRCRSQLEWGGGPQGGPRELESSKKLRCSRKGREAPAVSVQCTPNEISFVINFKSSCLQQKAAADSSSNKNSSNEQQAVGLRCCCCCGGALARQQQRQQLPRQQQQQQQQPARPAHSSPQQLQQQTGTVGLLQHAETLQSPQVVFQETL